MLLPAGTLRNSQSPSSRDTSSDGYKLIYSFAASGKADDGQAPQAKLAEFGGDFYGTTAYGGTTNNHCAIGCGIVFRLSSAGKESVVYRFKGGSDGAAPLAGLIVANGSLIGTTSAGGDGTCAAGCGTIFSVSTSGKERVLHSFGGSDGANPAAGLVAVGTSLYGTTQLGGKVTPLCHSGCGTVFQSNLSGTTHVVYRFAGPDGAMPLATLLVLAGKLYGTTQYGGTSTSFCQTGCGTVFVISTSGIEKILHGFKFGRGQYDGAFPAAGLVARAGLLYGTTIGGGKFSDGSVYQVNISSGAESVLHSFHCCGTVRDGRYPVAPLIVVQGKLYGTTFNGGGSNAGTVFTVAGSKESVLHDFAGKPDGAAPRAALVDSGGLLYGSTSAGGSSSEGSIFKLLP